MNSRDKGNTAEREVAKLLQVWWSKLEPAASFVRTPSSGGWSNPGLRAEYRASGDLMTTAQQWPFSVEVKRREEWSLCALINGHRTTVFTWWCQCIKAADEMQAQPMLWFRKCRQPWYVMLPEAVALRALGSPLMLDMYWPHVDMVKRAKVGGVKPAVLLASKLLAAEPSRFTREVLYGT